MESRPYTHLGLCCDVPVVLSDYGIDGCKTQAAASLLGSEVGIEYPLEMVFRYANALILNGYFYICSRL